jgi:NTE family protein/lysophospholipid hydrolase
LVRVFSDETKEPQGTAAFLETRKVAAHHHIRVSVAADYERLARFVAGRPIALALSGGGIRGYAHLGLLRALREAGVPVDLLSGTSGGSIIASQYARGTEPEGILENALRENATNIFDPTLPLVALLAGFRYRRNLLRVYGESRLEDTWKPCFLVAADLRTAELVVLDHGFSWHAVRASTSVPGVMPPVRWNERMLVDGGVLNNLPVDVVRERGGDPWVIACDVSDPSAGKWPIPYDDAISGFRVFWNRLWKRPSPPGMAEIIARASTLRAAQQVAAIASDEEVLYLRPPMSGFGTFQMSAVSELVAVGYDSARRAVDEWLKKGRLPKNGWA